MSLSTKEKKHIRDKLRGKSRINIGDCFEEWRRVRNKLDFVWDRDLCYYLLNMYKEHEGPVTSTPMSKGHVEECTMTPISRKRPQAQGAFRQPVTAAKKLKLQGVKDGSTTETADEVRFVHESDADTACSEEAGPSVDPDDPSLHVSQLTEDTEESTDYTSYAPSNQTMVQNAADIDDMKTLLVNQNHLLQLCQKLCKRCTFCSNWQRVDIDKIGTACVMKWVCEEGHVSYKWHSQPQVKYGIYAGDILVSAAILLSGNNFEKQQLFFNFLKMEKSVETKLFNSLQQQVICPVVEEHWQALQNRNIESLKGKEVILCGDGRNDSPGHSAQYCTYTVMNHETLDILSIVIIDKRQTELKSPNMERLGFQTAIDMLLRKGVKVKEVVTDQHPGIIGLMKRRYPNIIHSFDIWHVAKNLGKRLSKAATQKHCKPLLPWLPDVVRHFWWVTRECGGSVWKFQELWRGVLHHVQGRHEWIGFNGCEQKCQHAEDFKERDDLLKPDTPAFSALSASVLDKRFLKQAAYYVRFRKTGELETFNQLILKYCSKRHAFGYPVYKARNQLAAIDYTEHKDRDYAYTKDSTEKLSRKYSKSTSRWVVSQKKTPKSYSYVNSMVKNVFEKKMALQGSLCQKSEMKPDDPRRIAPSIAPKEPPPSREIFDKQTSRFKVQTVEEKVDE